MYFLKMLTVEQLDSEYFQIATFDVHFILLCRYHPPISCQGSTLGSSKNRYECGNESYDFCPNIKVDWTPMKDLPTIFSSPEQEVLMVSYCYRSLSVVVRLCIVRRASTFGLWTL